MRAPLEERAHVQHTLSYYRINVENYLPAQLEPICSLARPARLTLALALTTYGLPLRTAADATD